MPGDALATAGRSHQAHTARQQARALQQHDPVPGPTRGVVKDQAGSAADMAVVSVTMGWVAPASVVAWTRGVVPRPSKGMSHAVAQTPTAMPTSVPQVDPDRPGPRYVARRRDGDSLYAVLGREAAGHQRLRIDVIGSPTLAAALWKLREPG